MDSVLVEIQNAFVKHPQLDWLVIFAVALGGTLVSRGIVLFFIKRFNKRYGQSNLNSSRQFSLQNTIYQLSKSTHWWVVFFWLFHQLAKTTYQSESALKITFPLMIIASGFQASAWGLRYIEILQTRYIEKKISKDAGAQTVSELISTVLKGTFIVLIILVCLSHLGINIGTFVAGLGIGGIAIALAAQNILGDIFASLSIIFDKPFVIGDYITVGQEQGTVEHVGIKTTRVRSLSGEELIFSNKDLLESRIRNFRRMWKRRVVVSFVLPLSIEEHKLREVPQWVQSIIASISDVSLDRCHLTSFANAQASFEVVYWVNNSSFNVHMDIQQKFLLNLLQKLNSERVSIARPIQELTFSDNSMEAINFRSNSQEMPK